MEHEFLDIMDYIELVPENYSVYSIKLMQLLLSIGSEFEAVLKEICSTTEKSRTSMMDYAPVIFRRYPKLLLQKICVVNKSITLAPFAGWNLEQPAKSLEFWNAYNDVKHHRTERYSKASFGAVLNALAALFTLNMYRLHEIYMSCDNLPRSVPEEESRLFYPENWTRHIRTSVLKFPYRVYDDDAHEEFVF